MACKGSMPDLISFEILEATAGQARRPINVWWPRPALLLINNDLMMINSHLKSTLLSHQLVVWT